MVDKDEELEIAGTVVESLSEGSLVSAEELSSLMRRIMELLSRENVPVDKTGKLALANHIASFISRYRSRKEVPCPTGFEDQIPKEDVRISKGVAALVSAHVGAEVPQPEVVLIASHIAAMKLRAKDA